MNNYTRLALEHRSLATLATEPEVQRALTLAAERFEVLAMMGVEPRLRRCVVIEVEGREVGT
jgi:recombinational DNA repair protein (RecF pathway)